MSDPYTILGVSRNAADDEIKKAYRALCRKYHPDTNVNKPDAEQTAEKFTQVQQAYQQIMDERKHGNFGCGTGYGFGYGEGMAGNSAGSSDEYALHMQAAANYISTRHFREALRVLSNIPQRTAQWYYLSAVANAGVGNNFAAAEQAKTAASMEPDHPAYRNLAASLGAGTYRYDDMSDSYGGPRGRGDSCLELCCLYIICDPCFNPCGCC